MQSCLFRMRGSAGAQRHAARRPPEAPRPTHPGKLAARSAPRRRPAGGSPADTPRLLSRARERRRASATPLGVRRRLSLRPHPGKLAARSAPRRRPAGGSPADTPRPYSLVHSSPFSRRSCAPLAPPSSPPAPRDLARTPRPRPAPAPPRPLPPLTPGKSLVLQIVAVDVAASSAPPPLPTNPPTPLPTLPCPTPAPPRTPPLQPRSRRLAAPPTRPHAHHGA